ncbi:MAG: hypothetical protein AAB542_04315 [Patescibacteria group bacterium]
MNKKPDAMIYAMALGGLIIAGIITTAIINVVRNNQSSAVDIRAKAGVTNTLKLTGTVDSIDETAGTITVLDVQFAEESRSGKAVNYGRWTVTPPVTFSLMSAIPGANITFTVASDSFNVVSKQVTAANVVIKQK